MHTSLACTRSARTFLVTSSAAAKGLGKPPGKLRPAKPSFSPFRDSSYPANPPESCIAAQGLSQSTDDPGPSRSFSGALGQLWTCAAGYMMEALQNLQVPQHSWGTSSQRSHLQRGSRSRRRTFTMASLKNSTKPTSNLLARKPRPPMAATAAASMTQVSPTGQMPVLQQAVAVTRGLMDKECAGKDAGCRPSPWGLLRSALTTSYCVGGGPQNAPVGAALPLSTAERCYLAGQR